MLDGKSICLLTAVDLLLTIASAIAIFLENEKSYVPQSGISNIRVEHQQDWTRAYQLIFDMPLFTFVATAFCIQICRLYNTMLYKCKA